MEEIAGFRYPSKGTFAEALQITKVAEGTFGGMITTKDAAGVLNYDVATAKSIAGPIYRRLDELTEFGLFTRERGGYRVTDLGARAVDQVDSQKAAQAKSEALRKLIVLQKMFTELKGEIPSETALPAKISTVFGITLKEAQNHTPFLGKLIVETFPLMKVSSKVAESASSGLGDRRETATNRPPATESLETVEVIPFGEVRTTVGTIIVRDKEMIPLAHQIIDQLNREFSKREKQPEKKTKDLETKQSK